VAAGDTSVNAEFVLQADDIDVADVKEIGSAQIRG
jgi:hypothetical protein